MLNSIKLLSSILIIVLVAPQTPEENILLKALHSKRILANYGTEKRFLNKVTWFCILSFLAITFLTSVK